MTLMMGYTNVYHELDEIQEEKHFMRDLGLGCVMSTTMNVNVQDEKEFCTSILSSCLYFSIPRACQ